MPKLYGIIGLICLGIGIAVVIYGLVNFNEEDLIPLFLSFVLSAGLGMVLVLETWVAKVLLTEDSIIRIQYVGAKKANHLERY